MPRFSYIAINGEGNEVRGAVDAGDVNDARQNLRGRALMPISLDLEAEAGLLPLAAVGSFLNPINLIPISGADKQFMFRQLALMVKSGHRLRSSLEIVEELVRKRRLKRAISQMIAHIDQGGSFEEALKAQGKLFPSHVASLVGAGEKSGTLDIILDEVASSMERAQALRNAVLRAIIMPSITLVVAFAVIAGMVFGLVPILSRFLESTGQEMHWTMLFLVSLAEFLKFYGKDIGIGLGVTVFALSAAYTTERGRLILDRILIATPIFGRTVLLYEMSRLGGIGMLLIRAGLRQVDALRVLADVTQNYAYRKHYQTAADHLLEGEAMHAALKSSIVDRMAQHMIRVGETSGRLEEVLDRLGIHFADEVETRIRMLISTMVPAVTIFVGVIVAFIYISLVLTILSALNSVR